MRRVSVTQERLHSEESNRGRTVEIAKEGAGPQNNVEKQSPQ
jgi:hypothetical protein